MSSETDKISYVLSSMSFEILLSDTEQSPVSSLCIVLNYPRLILSCIVNDAIFVIAFYYNMHILEDLFLFAQLHYVFCLMDSTIFFPGKSCTSSYSISVWPSKEYSIWYRNYYFL